jgi:transcriptional regulator with XRE-family HTH domain
MSVYNDMSEPQTSPLGEWLVREARLRGWSMREVARRTRSTARPEGFTNTTISDIAKGSATTPDVCRGLAHAFGVSEEEVMTRAGILVDRGDILPEVREWSDRLRSFSPKQRTRLIQIIDRLFELVQPPTQQIVEEPLNLRKRVGTGMLTANRSETSRVSNK